MALSSGTRRRTLPRRRPEDEPCSDPRRGGTERPRSIGGFLQARALLPRSGLVQAALIGSPTPTAPSYCPGSRRPARRRPHNGPVPGGTVMRRADRPAFQRATRRPMPRPPQQRPPGLDKAYASHMIMTFGPRHLKYMTRSIARFVLRRLTVHSFALLLDPPAVSASSGVGSGTKCTSNAVPVSASSIS
jgi:hypothetical protein